MKNMGRKSSEWPASVGIHTLDDLAQLSVVGCRSGPPLLRLALITLARALRRGASQGVLREDLDQRRGMP
jgi:hypothetical protein